MVNGFWVSHNVELEKSRVRIGGVHFVTFKTKLVAETVYGNEDKVVSIKDTQHQEPPVL